MTLCDADTSVDGFLGGKLKIRQPIVGYRAATDPVFLAAAVNCKAGDRVLELGCGVGVASLCLGHRVTGLALVGIELQADYAELAHRNAKANNISMDVYQADIQQLPNVVVGQSFDHVIFNPPFFQKGTISEPQSLGRELAHVEALGLADWISIGLRRLRTGGRLTTIHLVERLPEILAGLTGRAGRICVLPIAPRKDQPTKRVLISAQKGSKAPMMLLPPFVVHDGDRHVQGERDYSDMAKTVLEKGGPLVSML